MSTSTNTIDEANGGGAGGGDAGAGAGGGAGGGASGGGGASAILADAAAGGGGDSKGTAADTAAAADVSPADWMKQLTTDPDALKWMGNKAFSDPAKMVDAFRETERAFRTAIPAEGDPAERWDAFYKRIGRPDDAKGYEIAAPDGFETNPEFTDRFREVLFKNGIPAKAAAALVEWYNGEALGGIEAQAQAVKAQQAALKRDWGSEYNANVEVARRGMALLDLDSKAIDAMSQGYGVDNTLKLLNRIGTMTSEDMMRGGGGRAPGFTTDPATAQAKVDAFLADPEKSAKARAGDPAATDEWNRLNAGLASAREAAKKRG